MIAILRNMLRENGVELNGFYCNTREREGDRKKQMSWGRESFSIKKQIWQFQSGVLKKNVIVVRDETKNNNNNKYSIRNSHSQPNKNIKSFSHHLPFLAFCYYYLTCQFVSKANAIYGRFISIVELFSRCYLSTSNYLNNSMSVSQQSFSIFCLSLVCFRSHSRLPLSSFSLSHLLSFALSFRARSFPSLDSC